MKPFLNTKVIKSPEPSINWDAYKIKPLIFVDLNSNSMLKSVNSTGSSESSRKESSLKDGNIINSNAL